MASHVLKMIHRTDGKRAHSSEHFFLFGCVRGKCMLSILYNGDVCTHAEQCWGGLCENGVCKGLELPEGAICTDRDYWPGVCSAGLDCVLEQTATSRENGNFTCQPPGKEGESCQNHRKCESGLHCSGGECVPNIGLGGDCNFFQKCSAEYICSSYEKV